MVTVGISAGVAVYPDDGSEVKVQLNFADKAKHCLKAAKVQVQSFPYLLIYPVRHNGC